MFSRFAWGLLVLGLSYAADNPLPGDEQETIENKIGDRQVKLMLTGSAVRSKGIFKVYTVGSYIEQGVRIRTARELVVADRPKQMHLCMLRNVAGPDMADAFVAVFRSNHPEPAFNEEVKTVAKILSGQTAHKGDDIWFTHIPKIGFQCQSSAGIAHLVRNVEFSKAVWENYFGQNNVGESVKLGLLSRLPTD